jgi:hypothetical protein
MVFFVKNRKTGVAMPKRAEKNIDRKTPSSIPRSDSEWEDIDECEDCPSTGPSSSENNFAKCLRGAPDKEIQVMTGLNKHGYDIMKKLVKYLQKVIDVEKAYSSALKKLNDIDFPSIESVMGEKLDRFGKFKNGVNTAHQSNKDVHMVKILEDNKKEYLALQRNQDNYVTELRKIRNIFQNYIDRRQDYKDNLKKGLKKSIDKKNTVINKKEKLLKERQKLVEKRDYYVVQIEKDPSKASELGDVFPLSVFISCLINMCRSSIKPKSQLRRMMLRSRILLKSKKKPSRI